MVRHILVIVACLTLTGCTATRSILGVTPKAYTESDDTTAKSGETNSTQDPLSTYERLDAALRAEIKEWDGTPHVWGGNSKNGVDCSGLVQQIFADLLSVSTSRTTGELMKEGIRVRKSKLKSGDLVFFSPESKKGGHVGIYLSQGDFAHASSSRGVMTSSLFNPYWTRHYETGRRLISDESTLRAALRRIEERQNLARELQATTKD